MSGMNVINMDESRQLMSDDITDDDSELNPSKPSIKDDITITKPIKTQHQRYTTKYCIFIFLFGLILGIFLGIEIQKHFHSNYYYNYYISSPQDYPGFSAAAAKQGCRYTTRH
mmetsp:Transcript_10825/g.13480  ORF Transcript_10825/g.13480 Transcript_10825/m.13480 type:complete len:113 (+) Transcript_10825:91-429(+)